MVYSLYTEATPDTPKVADEGAAPLLGDEARSCGRRVVVAASPD